MRRRKRMLDDLDQDIREHIAMETRDNIARGMSPEEGRRAAFLKFGNVTKVEEETREVWSFVLLEQLLQDLRFALRTLRKSPGFTAVAVLTLALGIGANTAIFTLVHAVILQSLPAKNPSELYRLGDDANDCCDITGTQGDFSIFSTALYKQIRDNTPEFSELAAFQPQPGSVILRRSGDAGGRSAVQEFVSGNYFRTFGVSASLGRMLTVADDQPGATPVAVMSHHAWHEFYGGDPSVVGSSFLVDTIPFTVVGVAPPGFYGDTLRSDPPDLWVPITAEGLEHQGSSSISNFPSNNWLFAIGRLKPGAQPSEVQAHVTAEVQQWLAAQSFLSAEDRRDIPKQRVVVVSARGGVTALEQNYGDGVGLLVIVSGFILLIACANVACLLLAKATASRVQTAVRIALGATRGRLIRQMITEGIVLALLGGAAGLLIAYNGTSALLLVAFRGATYIPIGARPSLPIFGFALALSVLTGAIFATVPAWMASQTNPNEALRSGRTARDRSPLLWKSLVILQAVLSLPLLAGAGLLTETLAHLERQHFGFETQGRLILRVSPILAGYTPERLPWLYQQIEDRFNAVPGILSASYSLYSPMRGSNWNEEISVEGNPAPDAGQEQAPSWLRVGPHYFETIGTHVLRGRAIDERDTANLQHVAVVNQTFAREFFPHEDALGKTFGIGDATHSHDFQIVGIVEDAKYQDPRVPAYATFFLPYFQSGAEKGQEQIQENIRSNYIGDIELRVAGDPQKMESAARETLAAIDPNLVPTQVLTLGEQVSRNFNEERLVGQLTALYGALALILASIGLYGVIAFLVVRRTREIGLRMALGAQPRDIFRVIIREGAMLALAGVGIGLALAFGLARLMSSLLFGVSAADPWIFAGAAITLAAAALVACYVPARRAMKLDPMVALRYE
jgi:predicted permease